VRHDDLIRSLLRQTEQNQRFFGVVVGIVTNNRDPEKLHRIKVRFPWINQDDESHWARVATPMAGNGRGFYCLPEVDDEVLLAFEHGSVEHPYVIGALWNGKDEPHENNDDGNNDTRSFKSRSGHLIRLFDKAGDEHIEIIDKTGSNKIVINTSDNSISIAAKGDIAIGSQTGKVSITGSGVEIKSQAGVQVQAAQSVDVTASGNLTIKGAMINLN
jgi:uncharacterized protein involved in type VI secretion and phage assembly